jgi:hypothetical protein
MTSVHFEPLNKHVPIIELFAFTDSIVKKIPSKLDVDNSGTESNAVEFGQ